MKKIPLTQGRAATVDDDDYNRLVAEGSWHFDRYAKRVTRGFGTVYMHRLVINAPPNLQVDHINGDKLDNRKSNLRLTTARNNTKKQHKLRGGTSRYKGVSWDKTRGLWKSNIAIDYQKIQIGRFATEEEAAYVYDQFALVLHGEYAVTNFLGK